MELQAKSGLLVDVFVSEPSCFQAAIFAAGLPVNRTGVVSASVMKEYLSKRLHGHTPQED